ncbi:MAG: DNA polymerase subunit beta [Candidatus Magnetoglobus multicellularis str. Araruama]|uniref:DNA polymerase subunit beta n=1 Tax=Candidatus Magnetoglobus multicellularis str. Araruama TaxID=890399 RepID=A0A1V1P3N3_9BACT|nr:MAG: DNA polymerase subunit beta [Candidatus Magnetoglobus multicellularis str. Araruama]
MKSVFERLKKMNTIKTQVVDIIKNQSPLIQKNYSWIHVLYLFGSYAKGAAKPDSDIDIAIFIDNKTYDFMDDLHFSVFMEEKCRRPVEILVMQRVSPIVQHEVLKTGIRLYERDAQKRSQLELQSFRYYLDAKYYLDKRMNSRLRKSYAK